MRKVYRYQDNKSYWDKRWQDAQRDEDRFLDLDIYPVKYSEIVLKRPGLRVLELGAGLGRVLKHYHAEQDISGIEWSEVAVERIHQENPHLDVRVGDVRSLPYADSQFDVMLAFGVFHNLETGIEQAITETVRCLKLGGSFCISMRPDNIEMRLNEVYWGWGRRSAVQTERKFHKWLVHETEFRALLERHGLKVMQVHRARNVSLLYRIPWLRQSSQSEGERRAKGYKLNGVGRFLDGLLMRFFSRHFCNVLVFIGYKANRCLVGAADTRRIASEATQGMTEAC